MSRDAGDVNNAALPIVFHDGPKHLARDKRSSHQVQVKIFPPAGQIDPLEGAIGADCDARIVTAGGVYQDRGSAQPAQQSFTGYLQGALIDGVTREKLSPARLLMNRANSGFTSFRVAAQHGHFRAGGSQAFRHRATEYTRAAQHDGNLSGQVKQVHVSPDIA